MSESPANVCITGVGMVASLGCSFEHIGAAARAGMVRTQASEYQIAAPVTGEPIGVTVHAIPEVTRGFEGEARRLRILQAALADLKRRDPRAPWEKFDARFFLAAPDPVREVQGAALVGDETTQQQMLEAAKTASETPYDFRGLAALLQKAASLARFGTTPKLEAVSLAGHCGVAQCIELASQQLRSNEIELAIVGGFDSLLEAPTLAWLERTGRLKSPRMPSGLAPAEAGVFVVLETLSHAQARDARPLGKIADLKMAEDDKPLWSGSPPLGVTLAQLLVDCSNAAGWTEGGACWIVSDHNGESYRAMEWGHALVRALRQCPGLNEPVLWYPAISVGETYSASGAVAIAMVLHAWMRGYAPARQAVVLNSSDDAHRAAMVLQAAI